MPNYEYELQGREIYNIKASENCLYIYIIAEVRVARQTDLDPKKLSKVVVIGRDLSKFHESGEK